MRTWLSILGTLLLAAVFLAVRFDSVQQQIRLVYRDLFGDTSSTTTGTPSGLVYCKPGRLQSASCAGGIRRSGQFAVQTVIEVSPQGVVLPESRRMLGSSRVLDSIADELNASLTLPHDIPVVLTACGQENAAYDPQAQSITICDEWVDKLGRAFAYLEEPDAFSHAVLAAAAFTFAHEVGHALIDQYQLDFTGREEDVADQFAVYLLAGTPTGAQEVLAGAEAFGHFAEAGEEGLVWDAHSLDAQRYFNILCWSYGSNPGAYPIVLTNGHLPLDRALTCQDEYRKMAAGFDQLLQSHMRAPQPLLSR